MPPWGHSLVATLVSRKLFVTNSTVRDVSQRLRGMLQRRKGTNNPQNINSPPTNVFYNFLQKRLTSRKTFYNFLLTSRRPIFLCCIMYKFHNSYFRLFGKLYKNHPKVTNAYFVLCINCIIHILYFSECL